MAEITIVPSYTVGAGGVPSLRGCSVAAAGWTSVAAIPRREDEDGSYRGRPCLLRSVLGAAAALPGVGALSITVFESHRHCECCGGITDTDWNVSSTDGHLVAKFSQCGHSGKGDDLQDTITLACTTLRNAGHVVSLQPRYRVSLCLEDSLDIVRARWCTLHEWKGQSFHLAADVGTLDVERVAEAVRELPTPDVLMVRGEEEGPFRKLLDDVAVEFPARAGKAGDWADTIMVSAGVDDLVGLGVEVLEAALDEYDWALWAVEAATPFSDDVSLSEAFAAATETAASPAAG